MSASVRDQMPKPSCVSCQLGSPTTMRFTRTRLSDIVHPVSSSQLTQDPDRVRSFGGYNTICLGVTNEDICHGRPGPPRSTLTNFESGSTLPLNELLGPMSDIFISYSKADHALALKLSAFLEAEGWSVWWDKSLGAADLYRDEIMKQLAAARTVITIWTENSVKSDWVRAEAGRAEADGKLIPVKTADLAYSDIPLPFGEMHTENVASTELIRAAIAARLTKPAVPAVSHSLSRPLIWIGIVGGAITLFTNLSGILSLADWASELIQQWQALNRIFWELVFGLINVKISKEVVPVISITAIVALLGVG